MSDRNNPSKEQVYRRALEQIAKGQNPPNHSPALSLYMNAHDCREMAQIALNAAARLPDETAAPRPHQREAAMERLSKAAAVGEKCPRGICALSNAYLCMQRKWCLAELLPAACPTCDGRGELETGIRETPVRPCGTCAGEGTLPQKCGAVKTSTDAPL